MKPIEFDGHNVVFAKDQPEYLPLPAMVLDTNEGEAVTCWELTAEELEAIQTTGRVWLRQLTFRAPLQPVNLTVYPSDFGL